MSSSSESRGNSNKPRSLSTSPTSIGPSSSPLKCSTPPTCSSPPMSSPRIPSRAKTVANNSAPHVDEFSTPNPMQSLGNGGHRKRPITYGLVQGGLQYEDCNPPTKKFKNLQTTWNTPAPSPEATNYLNERKLELSRITRRAIAARMRYQRLRCRELDLIRAILEGEEDLSQTEMKGIDAQIGAIRNILEDAGVTAIGNKGSLQMSRINLGQLHWYLDLFAVQPVSSTIRTRMLNGASSTASVSPITVVSSVNEQTSRVKPLFKVKTTVIIPSSFCLTDKCYTISTIHVNVMESWMPHQRPERFQPNEIFGDPGEITVLSSSHNEGQPSFCLQLNIDVLVSRYLIRLPRILPYSKSKPTIMSFRTFPYDSNDPSSCTRRRTSGRDAHSDSASLASTSLISADTTSNMGPGDTEGKRFNEHSPTEQVALAWAKRRIILNSVTTTGWLRNITPEEKKVTNGYIIELVNQANTKFGCELEASPRVIESILKALLLNRRQLSKISEYLANPYDIEPPSEFNLSEQDRQAFMDDRENELLDSASPFTYYLHGQEVTDMSVFILLFANPVVEHVHISHWYASKSTPLRDEDMRSEIKTTPSQMLAESAVSVRLAIRHTARGKKSPTGASLQFKTDPYADEQDAINEAILKALKSPIHGAALEARLLYLHHRGMFALRGSLGLDPPENAIGLTEEDSQIVHEARQYARATGLLFPQVSRDLVMAGSHGRLMPDYSKSVYVPDSIEELIFPRADIAPPSTVHPQMSAAVTVDSGLSEAVVPSSSTDFSMPVPSESAYVELPYNFGDDFFDFPQTYPLNVEPDQYLTGGFMGGLGGYYHDVP
ncbi:hypothetical protein DEU56DRAFT_755796 [Suillus clintonianus]|uniref:uncharacterized protein n=1 Tax=Suillus clintonianus TaxID=1904413 RepID=UPI001B86E0D8|nr:uncharacterized protein DEU56DRAFT_755796 [Suillus clintonianus]KAG2138495.1 hypothetical protein DEU56DRAFT_755796 [Suillus clintonianus]